MARWEGYRRFGILAVKIQYAVIKSTTAAVDSVTNGLENDAIPSVCSVCAKCGIIREMG